MPSIYADDADADAAAAHVGIGNRLDASAIDIARTLLLSAAMAARITTFAFTTEVTMSASSRKFALLLAFTLAACDSPSAPDGAMFGIWGGEDVELRAGPKGVWVSFPCSGLRSTQPLALDRDGRFLITNLESFWFHPRGEISVRGTVSGPKIAFDVVIVTPDTTIASPYIVRKNRKATFSSYMCLVSTSTGNARSQP